MIPDGLTFTKSTTSDIDVYLSGLCLGSLTITQFGKLVKDLNTLQVGLINSVDSAPIKLPSKREQERIIIASNMPHIEV